MKKLKLLSILIIVFTLLFSFASQSLAADTVKFHNMKDGRVQVVFEFDDLDEAKWAAEFIGRMKSKNILSGYPDGTFRPNQPIKRVEAIVTAVRLMGLENEAKAKADSDVDLHFKDAHLIDKKYPWAKGYVIVALENGLFDTTVDAIQPEKPASRVWAASLLVRALDLQEEALSQMTKIPDFTDAKQIPAGAIGYVNVAVEKDIVSGYPDHTFKPNKNVTRAEMAALLDRTNDGLLEKDGAVTVYGTITKLDLGSSTKDGKITVKTFHNNTNTYSISPDLLVQYHGHFIKPDQLFVNDVVILVVKDNKVIEATLLDQQVVEEHIDILELSIEIEWNNDEEYELSYKNRKGRISAKIESKIDGRKQNTKGEEARKTVQQIINKLSLSPDMSKQEIVQAVLSVLDIKNKSYEELEIELKFSNGKKVEIEIENDDDDDDRDDKRKKRRR